MYRTNVALGGSGRTCTDIISVEVINIIDDIVKFEADGRFRFDLRSTSYCQYHETWDEAHTYLLNKLSIELVACRRAYKEVQSQYDVVNQMQEP